MRRFLAFAMCVSGFTLAVSWARADEPAAAPTDDGATTSEVATPSARPEIVRTEPGEYRRQNGDQSGDNEDRPLERSAPEDRESLILEVHRLIQDHGDATGDFLQQQLEQFREEASHLNERYVGRALELAQTRIEAEIAHFEVVQKFIADREERATTQDIGILEHHLNDLLARAERLESSAGEHVEAMRQVVERQIDMAERVLAEHRERRDAAGDRPQRDAARDQPAPPDDDQAVRELREKVRHLSAARDHLQAAGFEDLARETEQRVRELTKAYREASNRAFAARSLAAQAREHRDEGADLQPIHGAIEDLTNQVGELRRELRRLHREVDELRREHAEPDAESSDRDTE